ncbi:hypothetical protein TNCV_2342861 [Trichonephila clavipes]|nr:hypothetical protein TNCV_2342861 [Trichonephila clavipes]
MKSSGSGIRMVMVVISWPAVSSHELETYIVQLQIYCVEKRKHVKYLVAVKLGEWRKVSSAHHIRPRFKDTKSNVKNPQVVSENDENRIRCKVYETLVLLLLGVKSMDK